MLFELVGSILSLIITVLLVTIILPRIDLYIRKKLGKKYYNKLINEFPVDLTIYNTDKLYCILIYLGYSARQAYQQKIASEICIEDYKVGDDFEDS